uniref:ATP-dependent DNA helicase n=1 Tax=Octopus bimaculoides TaxID=37653 RepID=A0A0L8GCD1_OCTBM
MVLHVGCVSFHNGCIETTLITGEQEGMRFLIPHIKLALNNSNLHFISERFTFPLRLCYSLSMNKTQRCIFNKIGIYLPHLVFSNGQLYEEFTRTWK